MVKQSNASRFSTLKVFNFSSGSSSKSVHGGDTYQDDTAPPPPPPKDRYYLYNRSMSSLSPDSFSMPSTPLSPGFSSNSSTKRPSPVPSQSTADLHEFGTNGYGNGYGSASPITSPSNPAPPPLNTKKSFFGRMASKSRRSPRSATPKGTPTEVRPEGGEDSGISMPWNFQHNMHVDEGLSGLPPSWTTSLSSAGFTDEEIAAIQARKLANRSPSASSQYQYLYNDRPASPATTIGTGAGLPFLANPTPRTTSLPRQHPDNASISSSVYKQQTGASNSTSPRFPPPPPLQVPNNAPPLPNAIPQRIQPSRKPSNSDAISVYTSHTTASSSFDHPEAQYVYINSRNELTSHAPSDSSFSNSRSQSPVSSGTGEGVSVIINGGGAVVGPNGVALPVDKRPRTPPRRTFRVVNESPGMMSPPPAYKSPAAGSVFAQLAAGGSEKAGLPSSSSSSEPPPPAIDDAEEKAAEKDDLGKPKGGAKRLTALPPRLSLHEASDLSSWSESLFSAIPSAAGSASGAGSHQLRTPTSATSASSLSAPKPHASTSSSTPPVSISPSYRPPQPQRPIPSLPKPPPGVKDLEIIPHTLDAPNDGTGPTTPLWNEIMGLVQQQETTSPSTSVDSPPLTPALNDMHSPTIPITPVPYGHMRQHQHADDDYEDDDGYLGLDPGNSNRDSNMSTATVTSATIVRNASLATRAIANVVDRVPPSRKQQGQAVERIAVAEVSAFEEEDDDEEDEEEEELLFPPTPSPIQSTFPVDDTTARNPSRHYKTASMVSRSLSPALTSPPPAPGSPHSSYFSESSSSGTGSDSRTSLSRPDSRGTASDEAEKLPQLPPKSPELAYLLQTSPSNSPLPSPAGSSFGEQTITLSARDTFGEPSPLRVKTLTIDEDGVPLRRPSIVLNGVDIEDREDAMTETMSPLSPRFLSPSITPAITSQSPKRYRDWISDVLAPLEEFIDQVIDPRDYFKDLQEIAEAESGSVYAARLYKPEVFGLPSGTSYVAIKNVPILPSGSPKLLDLRKELKLTRGVSHENVLTMDTLYVDLVEDAVWIRMELMERSLADVVGLVADGLMVQERMIARFASDVLRALEYLQKQGIAHRDVRSDNLLLNKDGVLKIADFSNAVQVTPQTPECLGAAGVIYWQAPEMRLNKPYNALKVDVWSLGATVWETAQSEPPFADVQDPRQIGDRWPTLSQPEIYSRSFHEFLRLCSEPSSSRPGPSELLNTPFIRNACGRPVNVQLLSQCRAIEETMLERENDS